MDFMVAVPRTMDGNYTVWIVVDSLTKSTTFTNMKST